MIILDFFILQFPRREVEVHLESSTRLHLDLACVKLNETEAQLIKAREESEELRNTLEKFEETKRKHEEKINSLENKLYLHCLEEHTWKISGFNEKLRLVDTGAKTQIDSDPFYTGECGRHGYKFKIRLTLQYQLRSGLEHLSIQFIIMKGEYDSILPWPFRRKVIFTLVDQQRNLNDRKNIVKSIIP